MKLINLFTTDTKDLPQIVFPGFIATFKNKILYFYHFKETALLAISFFLSKERTEKYFQIRVVGCPMDQ